LTLPALWHEPGRNRLAGDQDGVALVVSTARRGGRSVKTRDAHMFRLRDGMVVEFWNASTGAYAFDELIG
jgi:ketosteroid isomerase-like protein